MIIKNFRIATQLMIGFGAMMVFAIFLGMNTFIQSNQIYEQIQEMYKHPLQITRAISDFDKNILNVRIGMRDLIVANSDQEEEDFIKLMALSSADAEKQLSFIKEWYLGPAEDVEEVYQNYLIWKVVQEEYVRLVLSAESRKEKESLLSENTAKSYIDNLNIAVNKIDEFSKNKADFLYMNSVELKGSLNNQLVLVISAFLLLSFIISYILMRNIRKPLKEMNAAVLRFNQGDMDSRSPYSYKNEFGILSSSINTLADLVNENNNLNRKTVSLADVMLEEEDSKKFFRATLGELAKLTESQMAAVYLLSDDKRHFEYYESIGMGNNEKQSFEAYSFEGEFGAVLISRKLQHIENIPEDTRFVFNTVNGNFIPREIITIPILSGEEVIAIISLSSISRFSPKSIAFIDSNIVIMSSRIVGILAYQKIKDFKEELEKQNRVLDAHKSELSAQTSELMQQNAELEMQKKQLNEASRLKTSFLSNMSHELRTPLNSVIALSGVLNRRLANQIPEEEHSYLEIIERNGKNLLMLINDILDISRIEAGREEIEITKFNANNLIDEIVSMIQPQAKQKNIELLYELSDSDLFISSDVDKCRHILQNIVANAVKFTEKGKVNITAKKDENKIEIKITDTGIGISKKHLAHIFDEFRQADGSTSRKFGGTGLGLAIAKKYTNLLGGTISVKSTLNEGSEFTLSLPLRYIGEKMIVVEEESTEDFKYEIKKQLPKIASIQSDKTILIVEDNESAIIQIKDLVEEMGYRVMFAHDSTEAFGIIDQVIPDAMILDLMMPGVDGFEVLEIMRNAEPTAHIPVLILTAKHITKDELKFLKRNNVHQLIQKGDVDRIKLQNAVSNMLFHETVEAKQMKVEPQIIEGKPVILVVEDNQDNMITVKAMLSEHYVVIEAVDGLEGIEMAKKHVPNLVLMDIALPGINGIEALIEIKKIPKLQHIPIIALTASAMHHDCEIILSHGFDAIITKPIIEKHFFEVIRGALYGK